VRATSAGTAKVSREVLETHQRERVVALVTLVGKEAKGVEFGKRPAEAPASSGAN